MVRVVIYGERSEETEGLEVMLRTILLVCAMGEKGAQIVRKIRANNPSAALIWLSDKENILEFWKLHANAFGIFPPGKEQLEECLTDCLSNFFTKNLTFS